MFIYNANVRIFVKNIAMRLFIITLFLLPVIAVAQDHYALIHKADSFFQRKDYAMAVKLADEFFTTDSSCDGCAYDAATYNAWVGNKQKAIEYLRKAFYYGYGAGRLDLETDFVSLHNEPEWPALVQMGKDSYDGKLENLPTIAGKAARKKYMAWQKDWETNNMASFKDIDTNGTAAAVYKKLVAFNNYKPFTAIGRCLFLYYRANDSVQIPYLVVLPSAQYNPAKKYPLLVVLHGAVGMAGTRPPYYIDSAGAIQSFHRHFNKYAALHEMVTIYPVATKQYNWMAPDDGFGETPAIINYLKHLMNIDDNSVYITGHSNGATGSFSYLMKAPSLFAAFSGMNTRPRVETGGTFLPNALNRSFYAIATDKDYYFPPNGNDTLNKLAHDMGIDWTVDMHNGFPHWFPQFDAADAPVGKMFDMMLVKKRNPFHTNIYWECDDTTHGSCDWLQITALDTMQQPASWHKQYNFAIHPWISNENPDSILDITKQAFNYPRRSGAVNATYDSNVFTLETSCVKNIRVLISPPMVNLSKPVIVVINGKTVFNKKLDYNKTFMLENFVQNFDRVAIWVNYIDL